MKTTYILIITAALSALWGCTRTDIDEQAPPGSVEPLTRAESPYYYWYRGQKEYLTKVPDKYYVVCKKDKLPSLSGAVTRSGGVLNPAEVYDYSLSANMNRTALEADYADCVWTTVSGIESSELHDALYAGPYFTNGGSCEAGLTEGFSVRLKSEDDADKLKVFAEENGAVIVDKSRLMPLWYSLVCTPRSTGNAMELANKAYESGLFAATDIGLLYPPSCASNPSEQFNDVGFGAQWNLYNSVYEEYDINFLPTSAITMGDPSINVAVLDFSFILDLSDLPINKSWDATSGTSPAKYYEYPEVYEEMTEHGVNVASVIHATPNNEIGIVGIAPNVTLTAISVDYMNKYWRDKMAEGIMYAADNGADVLNNSWTNDYKHWRMGEAVEYALKNGRNGKGCVVVFASGNRYSDKPRFPNGEYPDILTVGSMNGYGVKDDFSNFGNALDIVAPGYDIPVLSPKYNDYAEYNGTSFSAPHVAATAALILSMSPELTGKEVNDIIEGTAKKITDYKFREIKPNGTWDYEVGYGLLDSYAALMGGLKPIVIENKSYVEDTDYIRQSLTFKNINVRDKAELSAKSIIDFIKFNNLTVADNATVTAKSKKSSTYELVRLTGSSSIDSSSELNTAWENVNIAGSSFIDSSSDWNTEWKDVHVAGSARINSVSKLISKLENMQVSERGKLTASAAGIRVNGPFRVEKGAELRLQAVGKPNS